MKKRKNKSISKVKGYVITFVITVIYALISYYFTHPALDLHNFGLYAFIVPILIVFLVCRTIFSAAIKLEDMKTGHISIQDSKTMKLWLIVPAYILIMILLVIINSPLLNSKKYYERIEVDTSKEFYEDVAEVDFNKLPLLDRNSSSKLGDRVMGGMSELVSQYDVSDQYTQINYNEDIIRVTPLEYNGFIKWITNREKGITGYITVDSTDGKANLKKLEKGMKYAPSAYFNENLYRKLQVYFKM